MAEFPASDAFYFCHPMNEIDAFYFCHPMNEIAALFGTSSKNSEFVIVLDSATHSVSTLRQRWMEIEDNVRCLSLQIQPIQQ